MRTPPRLLIVDDEPINLDILQTRLAVHGYEILTATNGEEALAVATTQQPDLLLLDIMMPKVDGIDVCRRLKADVVLPFMPIILVTAKADSKDVVVGLEAGADEYLTKPVDQAALVARVKSMLRIKALHDTVQEQAARLEAQSEQLVEWNQTLEQRVVAQLAELDCVNRLKRFFPRNWPNSWCLQGERNSWKAIGARARLSSATCAGSQPSLKRLSPKRGWGCCGNITQP
ncbi:MAG TPA: response regulator [Methylomirabilota bacterium]|jgi:DNA-binding response OmpR family regulator|nr:response regulator [Methylomirabilota bacterium]